MTEQLVRLDLIKDNPYQGRTTYTAIEELGRSIAADDIQEKPKARASTGSKKNTEYELKFGHRRLRAFQWLKDNFKALGLADRYDGYTVMPLDVESLTYVCKLFSSLFDGITNLKLLSEMTSEPIKKNEKPAEAAQRLRAELARMVLRELGGYGWHLTKKGPVAAAKFFQGVATEWGVKLPGDFLDVAKGYAPVAVETDPIEKKKVKK